MTDLVDRANVVIVGGGAVGVSIAYHLAKMGYGGVTLLEKESLGSGSTGKCAGGFRHQWPTEINVKLSLESVKMLERFESETGHPAQIHQTGYLFLITSEDELATSLKDIELQKRLGVPVDLISVDRARELAPYLNFDDVIGATFCPTDGYADPHEIVQGYAQGARRLGAKLFTETEVTGIQVRGGRVASVRTNRGEIRTPVVVNAAGAWSSIIGVMVGVEVPVKPFRRQIFVTKPFALVDGFQPMIVELRWGMYFRQEGPGLLFGMADYAEASSYNTGVSWSFLDKVVERMLHRAPVLERVEVMTGWAGLYEITPDAHPILGEASQPKGFYIAAGFSGHGFMHSPVTGKLIAELIATGRASTVDIGCLSLDRFSQHSR